MEPDHSFLGYVVFNGERILVDRRGRRPHWRTIPNLVAGRDSGREFGSVRSKRPRLAASSKAIRGLKEVRASDATQQECAVCLQDFGAEETLRAMPCSHAFHDKCISEWLGRNAVCPLCRHQLPTEN